MPIYRITAAVDALIVAQGDHMLLTWAAMLALLPRPYKCVVQTTSSELSRQQFAPSAKARAVELAASVRLKPSRASQAASHRELGMTAHAVLRHERPAELRASER